MSISIESMKPGDGVTFPKAGQTAQVHYTGYLTNGTKFDSSLDRGKAFEFVVGAGRVIKAWDQAVPQMSIGQKIKLTAPPQFAYGERGFPPVIPANSTLIFEMELLGLK